MEPPVMLTLLAACVAIVPRPRLVLAVAPDSATNVEPLPTMNAPSPAVSPEIAASNEW
jgi:hypothetical protein